MRRPCLSFRALRLAACLAAIVASALCSCTRQEDRPSPWTGDAGAEETGANPAAPSLTHEAGTALLVRGTVRERGLPFLGRNALETLTGSYTIVGDDGELSRLDAWYCAEPLLIPASWRLWACPKLPSGFTIRIAPVEPRPEGIAEGQALWVLEAAAYRIFISLPSGFADSCDFAAALAERFDWFRRYAALSSDLSFPAVLDYKR